MEKSLEPSIITVLGTVVFRVIWLLTVFKMVPTYEMLMNVYVASWIFTGGLLLLIYLKHMRKLEKKAIMHKTKKSDSVVIDLAIE